MNNNKYWIINSYYFHVVSVKQGEKQLPELKTQYSSKPGK